MTTLPQRPLGSSDLLVTVTGLGCNNFGRPGAATESQEGTTAVLDAAIDAGITLLDTADIYGGSPGLSETLMGVALTGRRDSVILATKFGHEQFDAGVGSDAPKGSREYIRLAVEASLRRLQTDYIDLYQMHTPDSSTPIEVTLAALTELVDEGKIRFFGHSNFSAEQILDAERVAAAAGGPRFVSAQNHYSLIAREAEKDVIPAVIEAGVGFLPFFPLANGLLTGKFTRSHLAEDTRISRQKPEVYENAPWDVIEAFDAFSRDRHISMLDATWGWLLAQPGMSSVIAGATRPEQLRQNAAAGSAWTPTEAEASEISEIFAVR